MTETLTGKQVLALLAQDDVPEIEVHRGDGSWHQVLPRQWTIEAFLDWHSVFRIKPTPQRRLSVTLANGEVVSWPEPVRVARLKDGQEYWFIGSDSDVDRGMWTSHPVDKRRFAFGNIHLTREAGQEHADALRKINTQGVTC